MNSKILFISHSSDLSGAERSLAEIVVAIAKQDKISIGVVLPCKGKLEELLPSNISIFYCEQFWWVKKWYPNKYGIRDLFWIFRKTITSARKIIKDFSPDVIITNTSVICNFAIAAKIEKVYHCWHIRETMEQMQMHFMFGNWLTYKVMSYLSKFIYVNSKYLKNECSNYFRNIYIVRQAINCSHVLKHHSVKDKIRIAVIGYISPKKNQMEAIDAYKILEQQGIENISLSFIGRGDENSVYYKNIKEQINNRNIEIVQFYEDMEIIYAKTDIVLVCSLETFGRVAVESMKHSIPVIAANLGGSVDNIKNGYNGFLYEKGNSKDLAEKIFLLQDVDIRENIGRNGYKFAMENFNEVNMLNDFLCPLDRFVNKSL